MNNTLSIVPSEGSSNEFPVLKAFQEYIDAEQAKARKRMLGLSVFFIILLVVVVVTFVLVLTTVINRNQALSDRLLDYALKERENLTQGVQPSAQPMIQQAAPQPSVQDIIKPFIERLEREQDAMKALYEKQQKATEEKYEQQRKEAEARHEQQRKEAEAKAAARELARDEEIRKAKLELEKERARIKKENDRQAEIERQRRRLYPDYYRMQQPESADDYVTPPPSVQAPRPAAPAPAVKPPAASAPQPKPAPSQAKPSPAPKPSAPPAPVKPAQKPAETKADSPLSTMKPVTYFNLEDDGVPFLLETPTQNTK